MYGCVQCVSVIGFSAFFVSFLLLSLLLRTLAALQQRGLSKLLKGSTADEALSVERSATLPQLLADAAERFPERLAIVDEQGILRDQQDTLTYAELCSAVKALAAVLSAEHGVQPRDLVGLLLERSAEMVVSIFAVAWLGAAYVPVDTDAPSARQLMILTDCGAQLLLVHERLLHSVRGYEGSYRLVDGVTDVGWWVGRTASSSQVESSAELPIAATSGDLLYVFYTSGTTGRPKGVMVEHGSVVHRLAWLQAHHPLTGEDAMLQKASFGFGISEWEIFWPLAVGAQLVQASPTGHKDVTYLAALMIRRRVSVSVLTPSVLNLLVDFLAEEHRVITCARCNRSLAPHTPYHPPACSLLPAGGTITL